MEIARLIKSPEAPQPMIKISVVVPCYNEEASLGELAKRVSQVLSPRYKNDWELLLVDDISTDNTLNVMRDLEKKYPQVKAVQRSAKGGQAGCLGTGFQHAKGEITFTMDADLQVLPEDIPLFMEKMDRGYDLVNAIREHRKHPFWIKVASRLYNVLMLIFFNSPVMDASSNFMAVKTEFVRGVELRGYDHRYIVPIAMRRGAKKIGEVIVAHNARESGKSKYKSLPKYIKGVPQIFYAWLRIKLGYYDKEG
ncbi:glycosyltransferase family 2 protein [Candidatus Woesearchaeota archaeon]|nr:glycosyltransferase family 2 protein [Candidatus Woesearchaeota archaeon]